MVLKKTRQDISVCKTGCLRSVIEFLRESSLESTGETQKNLLKKKNETNDYGSLDSNGSPSAIAIDNSHL